LICEQARGEAFEYARRCFAPPFPLLTRIPGGGRSLRVHPPSFCVSFFAMVLRKGGEAFEYTRRRFAFPFLRWCCGRGAKPSSTPATVLRPPSSSGVLREGAKPSSTSAVVLRPPFPANRIGFVLAGFFGCTLVSCMGFFRCRCHHTKFTKNSTKTRKRKNRLDGTHIVPSPVPHTKFSKINEIHKKGGQGREVVTPLARAPPGAKPSSTSEVVLRPPSLSLRESPGGGEAFEYIRSRFAFPFLRWCCGRGAKPSSTLAVVLRPRFVWVCCRRGRFPPPPCASPLGRSLRVNPRSFSSSSPPCASPGAKPSSTSAVVLRFLFCDGAAEGGRSLRVHPQSFFAPLPSPKASHPGAKPSSTPAVVLRPPSSSGVLREGAFYSPLARAGWTRNADDLS
jgi:hypothetical protein